MNESLPIDSVLLSLHEAFENNATVILRAPPGAGKTTRVPLAMLDAPWLREGRIVMLEPRRLAARAAAVRMAATIHEDVGRTVGYRMRLDTRVSRDTRIEVVTEGVLTRMLQDDPSLDGTALLIFDEFHERSIHADLGLALALNARSVLRPDLRILIMSATLDTDRVVAILNEPAVVTSEGRSWPVETRWLDQPVVGHVDTATARVALNALHEHEGDLLVFLPGAAEIRRAAAYLSGHVDATVDVYPLHGQLPQDVQDRALAASPRGRRKIVLATSIAETSLTIDGVRIVVDSGLMRIPRFSARTGMTRLETTRVTRAAADQRRGRAGRVAPGQCYRLWTRSEDAGLVPHRTAEILDADLAPLALELAAWGTHPDALSWIDPPPAAALLHANAILHELHALDESGRITERGREVAAFGLHPRLGHMLLEARDLGMLDIACDVAALLSGRDLRTNELRDPDLRLRLDMIRRNARDTRDKRSYDPGIAAIHREAAHIRQRVQSARTTAASVPSRASIDEIASENAGLLLAFAYPDRIAQRRPASRGRFLLRNGRGARVDTAGAVAHAEFIAIASLDDAGSEALVQLAAPLDVAYIEKHFSDDIEEERTLEWDEDSESVWLIRTRRLGAIVLAQSRALPTVEDAAERLLADRVRARGVASLDWPDDVASLRHRVAFARSIQHALWPDLSDGHLDASMDVWLVPFLHGKRRLADVNAETLRNAITALLPYPLLRDLDSFAPSHFTAPGGSSVRIDYSDPRGPTASVRLQEMFGSADSPRVANDTVRLTLQLLSPAGRPIQVTSDLAGFWNGSYFDVRKDMRGRYPKHDWPTDPAHAAPSRRPRRPPPS